MKVAIAGATGYTGQILLRLLCEHPEVSQIIPVSSSQTGASVLDTDTGLSMEVLKKLVLTAGTYVDLVRARLLRPDVIFGALPHLVSATLLSDFLGESVIIDLSADFRFEDPALFEAAYGCPPPRPDLLGKAVYGLCEWYGEKIKNYDIIAVPGCYPTVSLLPLLPVQQLIKDTVIINAISGISGAGKKLEEMYLYCARTESVTAYAPGTRHRHQGEIAKEINKLTGKTSVLFTPHLAPLKRGMIATITFAKSAAAKSADIGRLLSAAYADQPFIRLCGSRIPASDDVRGSNRCDIGWQEEENHIMLFSALDNLIKGASGAAVQNMNLRFGFAQSCGLPLCGEV